MQREFDRESSHTILGLRRRKKVRFGGCWCKESQSLVVCLFTQKHVHTQIHADTGVSKADMDWSKTALSVFISWEHEEQSTLKEIKVKDSIMFGFQLNWPVKIGTIVALKIAEGFFPPLYIMINPDFSGETNSHVHFWSTRMCFLLCEELQRQERCGKQIIPVTCRDHQYVVEQTNMAACAFNVFTRSSQIPSNLSERTQLLNLFYLFSKRRGKNGKKPFLFFPIFFLYKMWN